MPSTETSLTDRQREIFDFIRNAVTEFGAPPTREEIAKAFGFRSLNAAEQHVQALNKKGLIELIPGASRGIRIKGEAGGRGAFGRAANESPVSSLPLIGKVAAGSPILAQENVLRQPAIDPLLFRPRADYLLEVRGMSMRDAGILEGDWLAVHKQSQADSGQMVVARLGDDVTVKTLHMRGSRVELVPHNSDFAPIVVDTKRDAFAIEGLVVGVIRQSV